MKKKNVMTGIGLGALATGAAAMAAGMMTGSSATKSIAKKANKAMKQMGDIMHDIQYMFK